MDILRSFFVLLHIVGFSLLFGGWVVQMVKKQLTVTPLMRIGLGTMLASGLILAIPFPAGIDLNYLKLGIKFAVALLIGATFGIAITRERAKKPASQPVFIAIGVLALVNATIAIFWH